jgi:hypothetical protein
MKMPNILKKAILSQSCDTRKVLAPFNMVGDKPNFIKPAKIIAVPNALIMAWMI